MKGIFIAGFMLLVALIAFSGCPKTEPAAACAEQWSCSEWGNCTNRQQARLCADTNSCGTDVNKPAEVKGCILDPCAGVSCPDKCEGTTSMKGGICENGMCRYTLTENSPECGYSPPGGELNLETTFRECSYNKAHKNFYLFFTIKNVGEVSPKQGASIWVVGPEITYRSYKLIQHNYPIHQILWGETQWDNYSWQGQQWTIQNMNECKELDYQLIYCEIEDVFAENCTAENGTVLYSGRTTAADCNCT